MTGNPQEIQKLKLLSPVRHGLLASANDDDTAMVGSGQATAFVTGLLLQNKQDVMNSTLLAQLGASGQYDRFQQQKEWYNQYRGILENIGWVAYDFQFTERDLSDLAVSVDKIVLDFLKTYLAPAQLATLSRVIAALENSSDPVVNIFTSSTAKSNQSNFQVGICTEDADKNVMFSIGAFNYTTSETIVNCLFTTIRSGSASFFNAFQNMILNVQVYAQVRQAVIDKLGQHAADLIGNLVLPPLK